LVRQCAVPMVMADRYHTAEGWRDEIGKRRRYAMVGPDFDSVNTSITLPCVGTGKRES